MPGGDRTGPAGLGPMTGRAAGYCAGYPVPGYTNPISGRQGWGYGYGRGWGRGYGRGWGRGYGRGLPAGRQGWAATPYANSAPYYPPVPYAASGISPQEEANMLKDQAKAMQDEIDAVNRRISELESESKKKK